MAAGRKFKTQEFIHVAKLLKAGPQGNGSSKMVYFKLATKPMEDLDPGLVHVHKLTLRNTQSWYVLIKSVTDTYFKMHKWVPKSFQIHQLNIYRQQMRQRT